MFIVQFVVLVFFITLELVWLAMFVPVVIFKRVPFVPTPMPVAERLVALAEITRGDVVYDIGAGDGRLVHIAARDYGARATGFEIDPFVYLLARAREVFWKWKGRVRFGNFAKRDLSDADVVMCYMLPKVLERYQAKFKKELRRGTKIVSYAFDIKGWKPHRVIAREGRVDPIFVYVI